MECEKCGETDNVKRFIYFTSQEPEYLCWDCRWPVIDARIERDNREPERDDGGQSGLSQFM